MDSSAIRRHWSLGTWPPRPVVARRGPSCVEAKVPHRGCCAQRWFAGRYAAMMWVMSWSAVREADGEPPSVDRVAEWWRESRRTAFREQDAFRKAFPTLLTPEKIDEQPAVRGSSPGRSSRDNTARSTPASARSMPGTGAGAQKSPLTARRGVAEDLKAVRGPVSNGGRGRSIWSARMSR